MLKIIARLQERGRSALRRTSVAGIAAVFLMAFGAHANAGSVSYDFDIELGGTITPEIPFFDSALGTLDAVTIDLAFFSLGSLSGTNNTFDPIFDSFDGSADFLLTAPGGPYSVPADFSGSVDAAGDTDFFADFLFEGIGLISAPDVSPFIGGGTFPLFLDPNGLITLTLPLGLELGEFSAFIETGYGTVTYDFTEVAPIPLPGALPLFLSGLIGFGFVARRRSRRG